MVRPFSNGALMGVFSHLEVPYGFVHVPLVVSDPVARRPLSLFPQTQTSPLVSVAKLMSPMPVVTTVLPSALTCAGVPWGELSFAPLPRLATPFHPQHQSVPSVFRAQLALSVEPISAMPAN